MARRSSRYGVQARLVAGFSALAVAMAALVAGEALAQPPAAAEEVYRYRGADRDARLLERAKQEGTVVVYTSLAPTESKPLAEAFERKYGIKVELWRALSDKVVQRAVTEARGRRFAMDVAETNGPEMEALAREKVLAEFHSPYIADLPPHAVPRHRLWMPDRFNFFVVAYNTNKVSKAELPATYEGFAEARWRGRIGLEATDAEWMAALIKVWGPEKGNAYFRKLSAMKPDVRKGHVLLAELIAAGEVAVGLTVYNSNAETLKRKGAPIEWVPIPPVAGRAQGIGLALQAPHPHAALLFADFVLSPEGQALFNAMGRVPASTKVKTDLNDFAFTLVDAATVLDEAPQWEKLWNELFLVK